MRRALGQQQRDRLFETRLLKHCEQQLTAYPRSIAALEQTWSNHESVLSLLDRIQWQFPEARTIVLDNTRDVQLLRMNLVAGAIHVTSSRLRLRYAVQLAQRHLNRFPATSSQFEEFVHRLPWSDGQ